ncbi:cation diffusion facilitator family transporter [Desulfoscipio geothermicus]|uniref:Cobalt-zinc-cadmium efflux system protein n=1 Tax=Desulfoscipio geothermicus DSM 3669 TaxID=1121426 RepID=A0A1I6E044_9FIRM|nr:cation diffusion facilitator family transporter [Desulfoscipio geothermicus]SFR11129.1 cobalt-zinc-cadmium efflux system protein [Desulfoscipio geothermicus DSM 3669]
MHHQHSHHHPCGHNHGQRQDSGAVNNKLIIALLLTSAVFLAEIIGGYWTHSLALLSDAWHVLTDAGALGLTLLATLQARKASTMQNTYGFHRLEVVAAFINGATLFVISGWVLVEGIRRLWAPPDIRSQEMLIIAVVGLVANLLIALLLNTHAGDNLNVKSAFLHVVGDALASFGVIIGGLLMMRFHWYIADPVISIGISLMLLRSAYYLTRETLHILMEGTPPEVRAEKIIKALQQIPGVKNIHDVHIWSITSGIPSLTMHVIVGAGINYQELLNKCNLILARDFAIIHSTIQLEQECRLAKQITCNLYSSSQGGGTTQHHHHHHKHHSLA